MRLPLLILSVAIICLSSCGMGKRGAQEFYNTVTGINDTIDELTSDWHDLLDKASINKNYSALAPVRTSLGVFISKSRATVAVLERNKETETIINKETALLESRQAVVADVYPNFDQFTEFTPKDVMNKNLQRVDSDLIAEKQGITEIKKQLAAFAQKNGLKK